MDQVELWRPTGQAELDLVAESGWRTWPPRLPDQPIFYPVCNSWYATKIAREWNVPAGGVGYVTKFSVQRAFLDRYPVQQAGGADVLEHWIPAEDLDEFNAHIVGAIENMAEYRGPVPDEQFAALERPLPQAWRTYLQGESWLRRGWLKDTYLHLYTPMEMLEIQDAWGTHQHPGIAVIGGDGSREHLALDLREDEPAVQLVDISSGGWAGAVRQARDVRELIDLIESGDFTFADGPGRSARPT